MRARGSMAAAPHIPFQTAFEAIWQVIRQLACG
jgi:hypothetical protein